MDSTDTSAKATAARVARGDVRSMARLISRLEDGEPQAIEVMRQLLSRTGHAKTIGITGPPGAGKSTLVDQLIREIRARGKTVGVVAVDPSSPFSGGAILGDRLRMQEHSTDPGVFVRSLASRGHLGGLSRATGAAAKVLDAAGFDFVIIETVGVGQSEVDIIRVADAVVLVSVPGLGDDIQMIKAGIMEIGDIFVVNKADRDGADRVVHEIKSMLETAATLAMGKTPMAADSLAGHHHMAGATFALDETGHPVLPPILKTVAETGEGCAELLDAVLAHYAELEREGTIEERRMEAAKAEIRDIIQLRVADLISGPEGLALEESLARDVVSKTRDGWEAADRLFEKLFMSRAPNAGTGRGGLA